MAFDRKRNKEAERAPEVQVSQSRADGPQVKKKKVFQKGAIAAIASSRIERSDKAQDSSHMGVSALQKDSQQCMQAPSIGSIGLVSRVTRARGRQLSGANSQLLQLGHDGRVGMQGTTAGARGDALGIATARRIRHR